VADIGVGGSCSQHHAFDHLPHLFLAAVVSGGQLADGAVHIGLPPQDGRTVVEEVEVVGVKAFLLDDLELDVLAVQVGIESLRVFFCGQVQLRGEEEAGYLLGTKKVTDSPTYLRYVLS
jgi:hypothetical protein